MPTEKHWTVGLGLGIVPMVSVAQRYHCFEIRKGPKMTENDVQTEQEVKPDEGLEISESPTVAATDPKLSVFVGFIACCFAIVSFFGVWQYIDETQLTSIKGIGATLRMRRSVTGFEAGIFGVGTLVMGVLGAVAAFLSLSQNDRQLPVKVQIVACVAGTCLVVLGLATHDVGLPPGPALALGAFVVGALCGIWTLLSKSASG